ncbi:exported carboxylesterase [Mycobacteroides abscessus subsp. abscessus]|nr:exported carboxylesterase [Mycobacteroides abscessus subsp. abscessus]
MFEAKQYQHRPVPRTAEEYQRALESKYGARATELGRRYPLAGFEGNVLGALAAIDTDNSYACPTFAMAEAQFVKTGNPNVEGQPEWPAYVSGGAFQRLAPPAPRSEDGFASRHQCGYWR